MVLNSINNIDCIEFLKKQNDYAFDHTITDIPYDVVSRDTGGIRIFDKGHADAITFDLETLCHELGRTTKGTILIFCASEQVSAIMGHLKMYRANIELGVWEKTNPSPVNGQYFWLSGVECAVVASHTPLTVEQLVWTFPSGRSKEHPTEKPLKLLKHIVELFTQEGEVVYDPCTGSGNHLIAAAELGRNFVGNERHQPYFDKIVTKLQQKGGKK